MPYIEGDLRAPEGARFAIIASRWNPRITDALVAAARIHRTAGMTGVTGEHYEGGHWLGTFAVYLESGRGLAAPGARP